MNSCPYSKSLVNRLVLNLLKINVKILALSFVTLPFR